MNLSYDEYGKLLKGKKRLLKFAEGLYELLNKVMCGFLLSSRKPSEKCNNNIISNHEERPQDFCAEIPAPLQDLTK